MSETLSFLSELRTRLIRAFLVLASVFLVFAFFSDKIYQLFSLPLIKNLSAEQGLIATSIVAPFLIPIKSALLLSFYVSFPYWLYEFWSFVRPALYRKEKKFGWFFLFFGSILFFAGGLFAYFVVLPLVFHFFIEVAPKSVKVMPDIGQYFSFLARFLIGFGVAFELPVVMLLLVAGGIVRVDQLSKARPYVIIGAFVLGMLITPPDIISQVFLAVPLWALYEVGLLLARTLSLSKAEKGVDQ